MLNVLLSGCYKTADGLMGRNFYAEPVGFGSVVERATPEDNLGRISLTFLDVSGGVRGVGYEYPPHILNDAERLKDVVKFSVGFVVPESMW